MWLSHCSYVFSWICFVGSVIALFSPSWYTEAGSRHSDALFLECNPDCHVQTVGRVNPVWFSVCQGFWTTGSAVLLLVVTTSLFSCCDSCHRNGCVSQIFVWTLFAWICQLITAVTYGVVTYRDMDVKLERSHSKYFDWGYYLAIIITVLTYISSILFGTLRYTMRKQVK